MPKARNQRWCGSPFMPIAVGCLITLSALSVNQQPCVANHMFIANGARRDDSARPVVRDKWAVLVGVNEYRDSAMSEHAESLKNVEQLAGALHDPVSGQFPPGHILAISGEHATVSGITQAMNEWLARKALPDDMVVLYVSGLSAMGADGHPLLLAYDTESAKVPTSSLDLAALLSDLRKRTQSRYIVSFLDLSPYKSDSAPNLKQLSEQGVTVMTAADGKQESINNGVLGQSLFSHHLVEAIRTNNGSLSLDEVFKHVSATVSGDAEKAFAKHQTPTLSLPAINPHASLLAIGIPVKSGSVKPSFDIGHSVERLALDRPELQPPRPGAKGMVITSRRAPGLAALASPGDAGRAVAEPHAVQKAKSSVDEDDDDDDKPRVQVDYKDYMSKMKKDIQAKWSPPGGLDSHRIVVQFTITREGRILNPQILESSNNAAVDKSALAALQAASPLDALPAGAPRSIDVKYVFDWHVSAK